MKNRILSAVLVAVLAFSVLISAFPITAMASETPSVTGVHIKENDNKTAEEKKAIVNAYKEANYESVYHMFSDDLQKDYLDYFTYGDYSLYINRYTGVIYYKNNLTGQILSSNPSDPGASKASIPGEVLSQISLVYSNRSSPETSIYENSYKRVSDGSWLTITFDKNTITVQYQLGEPEFINRVPIAILADDYETYIIEPLFNGLEELFVKHLGEYVTNSIKVTGYGYLKSYNAYKTDKSALMKYEGIRETQVGDVLNACEDYANKNITDSAKLSEIQKYISDIKQVVSTTNYTDYNRNVLYESFPYNDEYSTPAEREADKQEYDKNLELWYEKIPGMQEHNLNAFGIDQTLAQTERVTKCRLIGNVIDKRLPGLTAEKARALEERAGYTESSSIVPSFKCSIVYTLNEDGSLSAAIPSESIIYNSSNFIVRSITPLQYFGYGDTLTRKNAGTVNSEEKDAVNDGYVFYPDGSGTIIDFSDFHASIPNAASSSDRGNVQIDALVYGPDYCYSNIIAKHREQVTMPVYGIVNTVKSDEYNNAVTDRDSFTDGFFAIIEEGSSLATITATSSFGTHSYISTYSSFAPRAYEQYDLAAAHSQLSGKKHYMVANNIFSGSFTTKYFMLTDSAVAEDKELSTFYPATYIGMAACYKKYLNDKGVISELKTAATNLPLYVEALGSMDVLQKILTFPVSVSTPLTSFADVQTMYNEFSEKGINNVNFKLTGFANGGMYYTYPARVWWESSLGGDNGYKSILASSKQKAEDGDPNTNFGIFPDFDFQFINNTAIFDGVNNDSHASKMLDNRYASKQVYNSVTGKYDSLFAILVRSDVIAELYEKFNKDYSKFGNTNLSVSTLGSVLNSTMDNDKRKDNFIYREDSLKDIVAVLDTMASTSQYSLMTDIGNAYALKYVDHILNVSTDSSHMICTSYTVPFYGMVLHGYVSYAGTPLNYTGSVDYNILRSIENGASLYYILCMQNTNYLKEDEQLSKYYGVDYKNWFNEIITHYEKLNGAIGNLQNYEIVDHEAIIAERVINSNDTFENNKDLVDEYVEFIDSTVSKIINDQLNAWADEENVDNFGKTIHVNVVKSAVAADAIARFNFKGEAELDSYGFGALIDKVINKYNKAYPQHNDSLIVNLDADYLADKTYESSYNYVTDSVANADDYKATDFTCDNGNVVIVTYKDSSSGKTVKFILNYNGFDVDVRLDSSIDSSITSGTTVVRTISKCGFIKIEN